MPIQRNLRRRRKTIVERARWAAYAASGAVAAFGAHEVAEASIVYSGPQNIDIAGQFGTVDFDNDGVKEIFYNDNTGWAFLEPAFNSSVQNPNVGIAGFYGPSFTYVSNLPYSTPIGAGLNFLAGTATMAYGSYVNTYSGLSQFASIGNGYVGVKFDISGTTHYGWIQFENRTGVPDHEMTLVDWAYEDQADTPIGAGHVPEPGSLALLAFGAAGLVGWRRRRSA